MDSENNSFIQNVPLYVVVYQQIKENIKQGKYSIGEKLPTEPQLAAHFDVSAITIRRAIQELCDEGFLKKIQGRGTFVEYQKLQRMIDRNFQVLGFTTTCEQNNAKPRSEIINSGLLLPSVNIAKLLSEDNQNKLPYIERICYADEVPIMLEKIWFHSKYAFILDEDLEEYSLIKTLKKHGISITKASKTMIEVTRANATIARNLKLAKSEPLFLITTILNDELGNDIYLSIEYIVGSRYRLNI